MKILVVCPLQPGTTKTGRDYGAAFGRLGHEVAWLDLDDKPLLLRFAPKPMRGPAYEQKLASAHNAALVRAVERERPRFVFVIKGFQLTPDTVTAIHSRGALLAGYWIDEPLNAPRVLPLARPYDVYFTIERDSMPAYREYGVREVHHLPSSADTAVFRPLGVERDLPIAFVGTRTDYREALLRNELRDFPIHVFGPGWDKVRPIGGAVRLAGGVFGAGTNEIYNRARINLNLHNVGRKASALNLRVFEVPAAGGFLLTHWADELGECYREDEHLVCYRSLAEMKSKLAHFLERPEDCERIARAGHAHFLAHHSFEGRAQRVIDLVRNLSK